MGGTPLERRVEWGLRDRGRVSAIRSGLRNLRRQRHEALTELGDVAELREAASKVKDRSIRELPRLLRDFTAASERQGAAVHFAADGEEAREIISGLLIARGIRKVVKSKSMTSEEIALNHELEGQGIEVIDTDLGERAVQLSGEKPSHIVAPAVHLTRHDFARLFREKEEVDVPPDPGQITRAARQILRTRFLAAEAAISGANILVAESGSVVLVTNEGNGRLGPSMSRLHIVVAGVEKLVETWQEAGPLLELLARSATGQRLTVYTTFIHGPQVLNDGSPQELHIVLLDSGRMRARGTGLEVALKCIRCGACLNTCPTFSVLGGHVFGGPTYPGPMGILWTAMTEGPDSANEFSDLCISCGLCSSVCPTEIPLAETIMEIKAQGANRRGGRLSEKVLASVGTIDRWASLVPALWNRVVTAPVGAGVLRAVGLESRRSPLLVERPLRLKGTIGRPEDTLVYFSDIYARFNRPEVGRLTERILAALGWNLFHPRGQTEAGMPYLSYGMVQAARRSAQQNLRVLAPYAERGYRIVVTEPTALYLLRKVYPRLVPGPRAATVAGRSLGIDEVILQEILRGGLQLAKTRPASSLFYHVPCHARSMGAQAYPGLLERAGYKVTGSDVTCCGIGGSFGYKHGPLGYDLSMVIGEELFDQARRFTQGIIATESSVCAIQLKDGLGLRKVFHPLELFEAKPPNQARPD